MTARMFKAGRRLGCLFLVSLFTVLLTTPVMAADYGNAMRGVEHFNAVFDVSLGDPKMANIVFWAVENAYQVDEVKELKPEIAVVFHGPAVKLISNDTGLFTRAELAEVEKFQKTLAKMKKEGVKLEVCLYAAKVMGIDRATIIPEIDQVGNGFVSVIGYQMQGYGVVRVP